MSIDRYRGYLAQSTKSSDFVVTNFSDWDKLVEVAKCPSTWQDISILIKATWKLCIKCLSYWKRDWWVVTLLDPKGPDSKNCPFLRNDCLETEFASLVNDPGFLSRHFANVVNDLLDVSQKYY